VGVPVAVTLLVGVRVGVPVGVTVPVPVGVGVPVGVSAASILSFLSVHSIELLLFCTVSPREFAA
jgi:hypothetical protein